MVKIGKTSTLEVIKFTDQGAYLDGGPYGEILLPNRYVPKDCNEGDDIEVFIYFDSEDRIVASTEFPTVMADEFGYLKVVSVSSFGAFLDWGLPKDLLAPFREQTVKMEQGKSYLVRVYVDRKTGRLVASSKINKFVSNEELEISEGDEVDLIVANRTDIGYNAIINEKHLGILYFNEIFKPIRTGD
ncbi:MAG TPA: S1-like domain-containing RNA-binding protein, partial [Prolixibacteraceae bacterium]|nr:S1-like domain-containing RNA-binding protein [Prolixibacteraceae bacterium]